MAVMQYQTPVIVIKNKKMRTLILLSICIIIMGCNDDKYRITNKQIGEFKLGEKLSQKVDRENFEVTTNSNDTVINSIITFSPLYKTNEGFGVKSNMIAIKSYFKKSDLNELNLKKGSTIMSKIGNKIEANNIIFVDNDLDNLVDFVWITSKR